MLLLRATETSHVVRYEVTHSSARRACLCGFFIIGAKSSRSLCLQQQNGVNYVTATKRQLLLTYPH